MVKKAITFLLLFIQIILLILLVFYIVTHAIPPNNHIADETIPDIFRILIVILVMNILFKLLGIKLLEHNRSLRIMLFAIFIITIIVLVTFYFLIKFDIILPYTEWLPKNI